MGITKLKGTQDFFGIDSLKYEKIISTCKKVCERFGYDEMITPIIEPTELFVRGVGDGSDIVRKEMYTFLDKGERSNTLRPEGTASITRSFVENKLYAYPGLHKFFYYGPMFRYERPQAGRFRQFSQFGVECFGEESPYLDADVINMCYQMLLANSIKGCVVHINTIGSFESRANYIRELKKHIEPHLDSMCNDCKERFEKNPLRILDCKVDRNSEVLLNAPSIQNFLSEDDQKYFQEIIKTLELYNIKYVIDDKLVRGLDYYTGCVFEMILDDESNPLNGVAIAAGGRYNGLSKELGGPETKAIGFAFGVERLMLLDNSISGVRTADVCVINLGEGTKKYAFDLTNHLRLKGLRVEVDYDNSNLKPQFKLADRCGAKFVVIIGEDEIKNNVVKIKNQETKEESTISVSELNNFFNLEGEQYAYKN